MFAMMNSDAYLYLYGQAIRAGAADPAEVARKGAEDFRQFRLEEEERHQAERKAEREALRASREEPK